MMKLAQAHPIRKAIFTVTGLAGRVLLTIRLRQLLSTIQYVAEAVVAAGIADLILFRDRANRLMAEGCRAQTASGHLTKRTIGQ
jgi:UTP-glucose-1-phosphate uridylyltransferase